MKTFFQSKMVIQNPTSFLLLHSILFLLTQAQLLPIVDPPGSTNSTTIQTYIVHVYEPDHADDLHDPEDRVNWYMSFLPNTTLDSGEPRLVHAYHNVISGFAARLTPNEVNDMESIDGFAAAYADQTHQLYTTYAPEFLGLNQYWDSSIWEKSNYGEGVIIGVLDSGILPTHPSFSEEGMKDPPAKWRGCCEFNATRCDRWVPSTCNKKLLGARAAGFIFDVKDETGHGTHTASTAAGNYVPGASVLGQAIGTAVGIAPRAHLSIYKVCNGHFGCSDGNILSGIDKAMADGVDVLSISIGLVKEVFHESGIIKGAFTAMEREGIITSACAGNEGITKNAIANDAPWILTVGASSMDRVARATVKLGNGMELDGESAYQPGNSSLPMMEIANPGAVAFTDPKLGCLKGALDDMNVTGKIVLCGVGLNENIEKGEIVKAAGGAALIVMNQIWDGFTTKSEPHVIPTVHVTNADALKIQSYFNTTKNPTATIIFKGTMFGGRPAPAVAGFSSRGPSLINGGIIKPDIVGPGVNILAAWNKDVGPGATGKSTSAFNFASGCSMATPVLAGILALLKSEHPDWSPAAIKSAIMTTAHTLDRNGQPIKDEKSPTFEKASHFVMGSGHVNPSKARDPGLVYDNDADDYIGYLCSLRFTSAQIFSITRRKKVHCPDVKKVSGGELNYPSILVSLQSSDTKTINRTVTNVGEASSSYSVQTNAPQGTSVVVTPTKLQFSKLKEKKSFTVSISKEKENTPVKGEYSEGDLTWVSSNKEHTVRSPIAVQF